MPADSAVRIAVLLPELLGTYGDADNAVVLRQRLRWRGIAAELIPIPATHPVPAGCDIYLVGGGEDGAARRAIRHLRTHPGLQQAVARGAAVLAVCAGLQLLGRCFTGTDGVTTAGLDLLDVSTGPRTRRAIGEVTAVPLLAPLTAPLTSFENHRGASTLGASARPLARVTRGVGNGTATAPKASSPVGSSAATCTARCSRATPNSPTWC